MKAEVNFTRRQLFHAAAGAAATNALAADWQIRPGRFTPDWDSLQRYRCPDWFRDAKFGIWAVWGPEAVPAAGGWYARDMYIEGSAQYKYHLEHFGHPSKFGYKDIVALWKAENWNPDRLMGLYKKAGAKYFAAIANHHDNFDCWDSKHHAWNSVQKGPKKDIVGLWRAAALKHGLRFGVTEHNARSWSWFNVNKGADKHGPFVGVPYDGNDPKYADLYFPPHVENGQAYPKNPPESFIQNWFLRTRELIDNYQPDLMYYDGGVRSANWDARSSRISTIAASNGTAASSRRCSTSKTGATATITGNTARGPVCATWSAESSAISGVTPGRPTPASATGTTGAASSIRLFPASSINWRIS